MKKTPKYTYLLRTCDAQLRSYDGTFQWPDSGPVEAPDWDPAPACGGGLHGLEWGVGDYELLALSDPSARWLVWRARTSDVVRIGQDKCKAPRGDVVYCGGMAGALVAMARLPASTAGEKAPAATAGGRAPAVAVGRYSRVRAGAHGSVLVAYWDRDGEWGPAVGIVGEGGILPGVWYRAAPPSRPTPEHPAWTAVGRLVPAEKG